MDQLFAAHIGQRAVGVLTLWRLLVGPFPVSRCCHRCALATHFPLCFLLLVRRKRRLFYYCDFVLILSLSLLLGSAIDPGTEG